MEGVNEKAKKRGDGDGDGDVQICSERDRQSDECYGDERRVLDGFLSVPKVRFFV